MKRLLFASIVLLAFISSLSAQTEGTLTVTATTSSTGGNYAPKNIVAMWIEDEQGNWVKTLLAYAATRKTHLNTWEAATTAAGSPFNTVDAITGATKSNHGTRTCTWNGTDVSGVLVADGNYKLRMELTDKNGTGNFSSFSFTKDTIPLNLTLQNVPSFASISIVWEPVITTDVKENSLEKEFQVYPNPTTGIFRVNGDGIIKVEVLNLAGNLIYEGKSSSIDITGQPEGIYYVRIISEKGMVTKKVLRQQ
jgi:hypothetical protein